jgi:hypothetical protein
VVTAHQCIKNGVEILQIRKFIVENFLGITWNSPYQAFKSVEAGLPEKGIGTGTCNVISRHHLELRTAAFNVAHQQHAALIQSQTVNEMIPATPAMYVCYTFS